jgi:hypothetical protein
MRAGKPGDAEPIAAVEVPVPARVHAADVLGRVDYEDAYQVATRVRRTPEQWLRAFLQDAPPWFQWPWAAAGKAVFAAQFGPLRGPDHVLGWAVLLDEPDIFAIGLDSKRGLQARLFALTPPGAAVVATQIRLDTGYARRLWPVVRPGHRYFAPYLLARAADQSAVSRP